MKELNELQNAQFVTTQLCRKCVYCVVHFEIRECEWDKFVPVGEKKSYLYTAIEFDCIHFDAR